jgi:hypothetical protein
MAMALSIWTWSSPATGAGLVGEGDGDGLGGDGGFVGEAVLGGVLADWGLVRLRLRDAAVSVVAARSAWSASFGLATVAAFSPAPGKAFAGEMTFHEATPMPVKATLAAMPFTTVGILCRFE